MAEAYEGFCSSMNTNETLLLNLDRERSRERGRRSRLKSKDRWDELKKMTFTINRATSFIFPLSRTRALLSVQRSFPVLLTTFSRPCCLSVPAQSLLSIYSCSRLHASLVRSCSYIDTHTHTPLDHALAVGFCVIVVHSLKDINSTTTTKEEEEEKSTRKKEDSPLGET